MGVSSCAWMCRARPARRQRFEGRARKHLCRHCPIVPVYKGNVRVVEREVVLEVVRQQVAGGARHITFGDPDFFNGVGHAIAIVEALHREFPWLSYDVTIKIEHLRKRSEERRVGKECRSRWSSYH